MRDDVTGVHEQVRDGLIRFIDIVLLDGYLPKRATSHVDTRHDRLVWRSVVHVPTALDNNNTGCTYLHMHTDSYGKLEQDREGTTGARGR